MSRYPRNIWVQLHNGVDSEFNVELSEDETLEVQGILNEDEAVRDYNIGDLYTESEGVDDFLEELGTFKGSEGYD